ncbi:hypothetical protein [Saccharibacillus sp. JS10]|uniref:hypothetical protein n=1 Tax=Saccharibacillus sp. JS10 TaxID=2950552 RepID=UPI00210DC5A0|nr:hypothetical protein [Saccharibacillus sp. JS10]MCQ4088291.1 hypothetical protein [Saccharibacillus sp. JS10]
MRKKLLTIIACFSLTFSAFTSVGVTSAQAATPKQWLQISPRTTYYGEVANGKPHGKGTIKWGSDKIYSGTFVNGKRSGSGKYTNIYIDPQTGRQHTVVYTGNWSGDTMSGSGTKIEKVTEIDGQPFSHGIQVGAFASNQLSRGYDVVHAKTDPDYSFSYRGASYRLDILGNNMSLVEDWKTGTLFDVKYRKNKISKSYSLFQGNTAAEEKARLTSLKYLQSKTSEVTPILWQFKKISNRLTLK